MSYSHILQNQNFFSGFSIAIKLASFINDTYENVDVTADSIVFHRGSFTGTLSMAVDKDSSAPFLAINMVYVGMPKSAPIMTTDSITADEMSACQANLNILIESKIERACEALSDYLAEDMNMDIDENDEGDEEEL